MLLYWLSAQSTLATPPLHFPGADKVAHFTIYAVLTTLLLFGDRWPSGARAWMWAVAASLYGVSDEVHQLFVPRRQSDVLDWLADTAGACLVVAAVFSVRRLMARRQAARGA